MTSKRSVLAVGAMCVAAIAAVGVASSSDAGTFDTGSSVIKGVDAAGEATNHEGYQQAAGVEMHKPTDAEKAAARSQGAEHISLATGGCTPGYGGDGARCLPIASPTEARLNAEMPGMAHHVAWTCAEVRKIFPQGIAVAKRNGDPLHLDTNKDGVACGSGD